MRLVIFGPQGAGKGTQAARIADKYAISVIATGDIFRWAMAEGLTLGKRARAYVESGRLVPDDITIGVVEERLSADDAANGFVLDGFPRNLEQAKALDDFVGTRGQSLDAVLAIDVPERVSLKRIMGRRVCGKCGRNYSLEAPPKEDWECDVCGGEVMARPDDQDERAVRERLDTYRRETEPLLLHYQKNQLLREIDGVGTPEEVFARVVAAL